MQINNYKQKAADYAKHSRAQGTLSLAYKEFEGVYSRCRVMCPNKVRDRSMIEKEAFV